MRSRIIQALLARQMPSPASYGNRASCLFVPRCWYGHHTIVGAGPLLPARDTLYSIDQSDG